MIRDHAGIGSMCANPKMVYCGSRRVSLIATIACSPAACKDSPITAARDRSRTALGNGILTTNDYRGFESTDSNP
jgi:hypothetical protein